jgi:hypothetical protein
MSKANAQGTAAPSKSQGGKDNVNRPCYILQASHANEAATTVLADKTATHDETTGKHPCCNDKIHNKPSKINMKDMHH